MQTAGKPTTLASPAPMSGSAVDLSLVCPACGLSARELYDSGRMGCSDCYDTFAAMVEQAAVQLHDLHETGRKTGPPILPKDRNASPWPTRTALHNRPDNP